jgi:hypothetical protein
MRRDLLIEVLKSRGKVENRFFFVALEDTSFIALELKGENENLIVCHTWNPADKIQNERIVDTLVDVQEFLLRVGHTERSTKELMNKLKNEVVEQFKRFIEKSIDKWWLK